MKRIALTAAAYFTGFVGFWLFCWAGDLIANLHWTTPADWEVTDRRVVFVIANAVGGIAAVHAYFSTPRRERGEAGR